MNKVILLGRITAKPEIRYTGSNVPYVRFTVAVNRQFNNQDGTRDADFINIVAIEGRLQTGSYDAQDGNKRYTTDVVLDTFHFVESKNARANVSNESPYDYQDMAPVNDVNIEDDPFADFGDSVSIDDNFLE